MSNTVTIPTATSIKVRFPEFREVEDAVIEFAIEEARLGVRDNWTVGYNVAIVYLTAHYVAAAINSAVNDGGAGDIASESWGRFSITYKQSQSSNSTAVADDTSSSSYGRRYEELVGRNFGGPVII